VLLTLSVDDPNLWQGQPVTLQVVGRPYKDEDLIAVCEAIEQIINGGVVKGD
jgi:amidase